MGEDGFGKRVGSKGLGFRVKGGLTWATPSPSALNNAMAAPVPPPTTVNTKGPA